MEIVESRKSRCKFDSLERLLIAIAPLDACGFSTYAYIQVKQSEAPGWEDVRWSCEFFATYPPKGQRF
jgi:hypothetical protein